MSYYDSIYAAQLPHRARTVYMYLKDRANRDGACWPGIRTIARELGLSQATVRRALKDLENGGWIVKTPRYRDNGSSTSNFYKVIQ